MPIYIEKAIKDLAEQKKLSNIWYDEIKKKVNHIKNLKKDFRYSSKHYILSTNKELIYKKKFIKKGINIIENKYEILNLKAPKLDELNNLLYELYANQFHCNYSIVQNTFKKKV